MGSTKNIVITPLTNRIFLTFTQALMMCLGGATHGKKTQLEIFGSITIDVDMIISFKA